MNKSYNIFKIKNSPIIYNLNICIFKFNIFIRRIFGRWTINCYRSDIIISINCKMNIK